MKKALLFLILSFSLKSQTPVWAIIQSGDTIPTVYLETVTVTAYLYNTPTERVKWDIIKYRVKKVYPYVVIGQIKLHDLENKLKLSKSKSG